MVFYCDVNGICQTERPWCSDRPADHKHDAFSYLIIYLVFFASGIACYKKLSKIFGWIKIPKRFQSLLLKFWLAFSFVVFVLFNIKISI